MSKTSQTTFGEQKAVAGYDGQIGNGEDIPTIIESDGEEERCPYCGNWYSQIGSHWSHPSVNCPHPPVSEYKVELLKGMMLGDGHLDRSNKYPCFALGNTNKTFINWMCDELDWISLNICKADATYSAKGLREYFGQDTQAEDCVDCYELWTRGHSHFNVFRSWYESGEIVFPRELSVSPVSLKSWYVSDGNLDWKNSGNSRIQFTSRNESERPHVIISVLEECNFTVGNSGKNFRLSTEDTEDFFDLIGEAPPGFEYKRAWQDHDRYNRLQDECKEKHCTQTLM